MTDTGDRHIVISRPEKAIGEPPPKKPYQAPRIVSRSALEAIAVACSPQPPGKQSLASCALERS